MSEKLYEPKDICSELAKTIKERINKYQTELENLQKAEGKLAKGVGADRDLPANEALGHNTGVDVGATNVSRSEATIEKPKGCKGCGGLFKNKIDESIAAKRNGQCIKCISIETGMGKSEELNKAWNSPVHQENTALRTAGGWEKHDKIPGLSTRNTEHGTYLLHSRPWKQSVGFESKDGQREDLGTHTSQKAAYDAAEAHHQKLMGGVKKSELSKQAPLGNISPTSAISPVSSASGAGVMHKSLTEESRKELVSGIVELVKKEIEESKELSKGEWTRHPKDEKSSVMDSDNGSYWHHNEGDKHHLMYRAPQKAGKKSGWQKLGIHTTEEEAHNAAKIHQDKFKLGKAEELAKVSPPGMKEVPEKLKEKGYPEESAFKIAWSAYNKKKDKKVTKEEASAHIKKIGKGKKIDKSTDYLDEKNADDRDKRIVNIGGHGKLPSDKVSEKGKGLDAGSGGLEKAEIPNKPDQLAKVKGLAKNAMVNLLKSPIDGTLKPPAPPKGVDPAGPDNHGPQSKKIDLNVNIPQNKLKQPSVKQNASIPSAPKAPQPPGNK